jgi:hypothetical protein
MTGVVTGLRVRTRRVGNCFYWGNDKWIEPRDGEPVLEESEIQNVCRSNRLEIVCRGRTNIVDAEPEPKTLVVLVAERISIALMELVGEPGSEKLDSVTERSKAPSRETIMSGPSGRRSAKQTVLTLSLDDQLNSKR